MTKFSTILAGLSLIVASNAFAAEVAAPAAAAAAVAAPAAAEMHNDCMDVATKAACTTTSKECKDAKGMVCKAMEAKMEEAKPAAK